jgi:hypothetical protein
MADAIDAIIESLRTHVSSLVATINTLRTALTRTEDERDSLKAENTTLLQRLEACLNGQNPPDGGGGDPGPDPTPRKGIWASVEDIRAMPITYVDPKDGKTKNLPEWQAILDRANRTWQRPLFHLDAQGGTEALAGLIVYIRLGTTAMLAKVLTQMNLLLDTAHLAEIYKRTLELGRHAQTYVYVADLLNQLGIQWRSTQFAEIAAMWVTKTLPGHSGFDSILKSASNQWNNWSGMARSSVIAISLYLLEYGNEYQREAAQDWLDAAIRMFKSFIGEPVDLGFKLIADKNWDFNGWYAEGKAKKEPKAGINPRGERIQLIGPDGTTRWYNVSGVNHQDRLRAVIWPTRWMGSDMGTGYDAEGGQAIVSTFWLLVRAGLIRPDAGDHALKRWADWLFGRGEAAQNVPVYAPGFSGDDEWEAHYLNELLPGENYPEDPDISAGKGFGFALVFRRDAA